MGNRSHHDSGDIVRVKRTSRYTVLFDEEEVKEALVHWLSRGRSTTSGIRIATMMNNSKCTFSNDGDDPVVVSFDWEELDEEDKP